MSWKNLNKRVDICGVSSYVKILKTPRNFNLIIIYAEVVNTKNLKSKVGFIKILKHKDFNEVVLWIKDPYIYSHRDNSHANINFIRESAVEESKMLINPRLSVKLQDGVFYILVLSFKNQYGAN